MQTPEIILGNYEQLRVKYEYIYELMGLENDEFLASEKWFLLSFEEIEMRHEFLLHTGKYTTPDPKKPQFKMVSVLRGLRRYLEMPESFLYRF